MILTDKEIYQLTLSLRERLFSKDIYFTKETAIVFNNLLKKVRKSAKNRKNVNDILQALGDNN